MEDHDEKQPRSWFLAILGFIQILCFVFYVTIATYQDASTDEGAGSVSKYYPFYQDIHVMVFVGFGLLMTFLKNHGFSSMGMTFLIGVVSIQLSMVVIAIVHCVGEGHEIKLILDIPTLIGGDFAAAAVLISYGAVLGRITPTQILIMTFCEIIFYAIQEYLGYVQIEAVDMGGSIMVHTFGAYFGLAVSYMVGVPENTAHEESRYNSDIFAFIGTVFLWMYWPSFNGALAGENNFSQERVVNNTVLSLCASGVAAFFWSHYFEGRLDMVHIQNATLAGGVAIGSSCDLVVGPWAAIVCGCLAGSISTTGYVYLTPRLNDMGVYDVCGIHNLHGMPGLIGALAGTIAASLATGDVYGENVTSVFAAREHRTAGEQAVAQFTALCVTLGMAIVGGLITGGIISNVPCIEKKKTYYHDIEDWLLPELEVEVYREKLVELENEVEQEMGVIEMDEDKKVKVIEGEDKLKDVPIEMDV